MFCKESWRFVISPDSVLIWTLEASTITNSSLEFWRCNWRTSDSENRKRALQELIRQLILSLNTRLWTTSTLPLITTNSTPECWLWRRLTVWLNTILLTLSLSFLIRLLPWRSLFSTGMMIRLLKTLRLEFILVLILSPTIVTIRTT